MRGLTIALTIGAVIAASACSSATDDAAMPSGRPSLGSVDVTSGVRFAVDVPTLAPWHDPVLDVYAPAGASGLPLIVLLPAHGLTSTSSPAYEQLAAATAEGGAVVVVATWSQREDPPESFTDEAVLRDLVDAGRAVAGCAVSYAVAHAADYGADPTRLVIGGELYGANVASVIAMARPPDLPSCVVDAAWRARGLLGLDGDWLAAMPAFDGVPTAAVGSLTPWPLLPAAAPERAVLAVTESAVAVTGTCEGPDPAWLSSRDPDDVLRERLEEVGAFADGCVDLADSARALAAAMDDAGTPTLVLDLGNPDGGTRADMGGHLHSLGPADLAALVDAALDLAE